jgi:hypothetical protein
METHIRQKVQRDQGIKESRRPTKTDGLSPTDGDAVWLFLMSSYDWLIQTGAYKVGTRTSIIYDL